MNQEDFEKIVAEEFPKAVPERFRAKLKNVAVLVEDEPSAEIREREDLPPGETLLGYYHGIPITERGDNYGVGMTLPDTITLYKNPIEEEAHGDPELVRKVIHETIWHEVAHYFGLDDPEVERRERERDARI